MKQINAVFLGTPPFAEIHLESLLKNPKFKIVGVVSQPDRPAGRKMQLTPSPVKTLALKNSLTVLTPENLRKDLECFEQIKSWNADVAIVVAFGQILSQDFLDSFKFGAVNVHGSLLPRWRGAAPIQRALEAGDKVSGVSLQQMIKKLDAGPIIAEKKIELSDEINATELFSRLAVLGCELVNENLPRYIAGEIKAVVQDESQVTLAAKIDKQESALDWQVQAKNFHNRVRAFSMGPGTFVMFQSKRLKIHKTKFNSEVSEKYKVGEIISFNNEVINIQTSAGSIALLEVQPESKPKMSVADFLKTVPTLKQGELFV